jgi:hypothetical protein
MVSKEAMRLLFVVKIDARSALVRTSPYPISHFTFQPGYLLWAESKPLRKSSFFFEPASVLAAERYAEIFLELLPSQQSLRAGLLIHGFIAPLQEPVKP